MRSVFVSQFTDGFKIVVKITLLNMVLVLLFMGLNFLEMQTEEAVRFSENEFGSQITDAGKKMSGGELYYYSLKEDMDCYDSSGMEVNIENDLLYQIEYVDIENEKLIVSID